MNLIWATDDLCIGGVPYQGFPILLNEDMESVAPGNEFLRYYLIERGRVGSIKSWKPLGQALYDYFAFLEAKNLDWKNVERGENLNLVSAYRNYSLRVAGLALGTVRPRIALVCKFYEYALKQRWVTSLPYSAETIHASKSDDFLAHVDGSNGTATTADVMPRTRRNLPKFLLRNECLFLLQAISNPHHKMMTQLGLRSGLRREEICTFPEAYVFDPTHAGRAGKLIKIRLDPEDGHGIKTKGNKPRDIYVTPALMYELWDYSIRIRGTRSSLSHLKQKALFLNQDGQPFAADGKGFEVIVREAARRVGLKASPHMLRHTYATHTLVALRKAGNGIEPLVFIMRQLGHQSIKSTIIYTHLVDDIVETAVLEFDDEITRMSLED